MRYSYDDYSEGLCTKDEYYQQFNPIRLELGRVYRQANIGKWCETHYKIVYLDDKIALGVSVYNAIAARFNGNYEMFNVNTGFKYNDSRIEEYQLKEIEGN